MKSQARKEKTCLQFISQQIIKILKMCRKTLKSKGKKKTLLKKWGKDMSRYFKSKTIQVESMFQVMRKCSLILHFWSHSIGTNAKTDIQVEC